MADIPLFPSPVENRESEPFYAAAREGRFTIRRCTSCGQAHWYPRTRCPHCSGTTVWEEASGAGILYSFSTTTVGGEARTLAYVTLAEGPTMMTSIVDCDPATLAIGRALRLIFRQSADETRPVPCFTPI